MRDFEREVFRETLREAHRRKWLPRWDPNLLYDKLSDLLAKDDTDMDKALGVLLSHNVLAEQHREPFLELVKQVREKGLEAVVIREMPRSEQTRADDATSPHNAAGVSRQNVPQSPTASSAKPPSTPDKKTPAPSVAGHAASSMKPPRAAGAESSETRIVASESEEALKAEVAALRAEVDQLTARITAPARDAERELQDLQSRMSKVEAQFEKELSGTVESRVTGLVSTQIEDVLKEHLTELGKVRRQVAVATRQAVATSETLDQTRGTLEKTLATQLEELQAALTARTAEQVAAERDTVVTAVQEALASHIQELAAERNSTWTSLLNKASKLGESFENLQKLVAAMPQIVAQAFDGKERELLDRLGPAARTSLADIPSEIAKSAAQGVVAEFASQVGASKQTLEAIQAQAEAVEKQVQALDKVMGNARQETLLNLNAEFDRVLKELRSPADGQITLDVLSKALIAIRDETWLLTRGSDMVQNLDVVGKLPELFNDLEHVFADWEAEASAKAKDPNKRAGEVIRSIRDLLLNWQDCRNIVRLGEEGETFDVATHELSGDIKTNDPEREGQVAEVVRLGYGLRRRNETIILQKPKVARWVL